MKYGVMELPVPRKPVLKILCKTGENNTVLNPHRVNFQSVVIKVNYRGLDSYQEC